MYREPVMGGQNKTDVQQHLAQTYPLFCLNRPLRLHLEPTGCSPDAAL